MNLEEITSQNFTCAQLMAGGKNPRENQYNNKEQRAPSPEEVGDAKEERGCRAAGEGDDRGA